LENLSILEFARALKIYPGLVEQYHPTVLALAVEFESLPDEIETWEWRWINELTLVRQARREADEELANRQAKPKVRR
jgi:hypothetical protein